MSELRTVEANDRRDSFGMLHPRAGTRADKPLKAEENAGL
jgi:hypothetical protein